jgi:hypothetical protein
LPARWALGEVFVDEAFAPLPGKFSKAIPHQFWGAGMGAESLQQLGDSPGVAEAKKQGADTGQGAGRWDIVEITALDVDP